MNKNILTFLSLVEIPNKKLAKIMDIIEREEVTEIKKIVDNKEIDKLLSTNEYANLAKKSDDRLFRSYLANLEKDNIKVITIMDAEYPEKLRYLDDAPMLFYYKGDISLLNTDAISIVGTRMPSNYGRYVTEKFAGVLASAGLTVVSGLAYGVDAISHRKALEVNGKTIAVLGGGLNHIYPEANTNLANEIAEKGLLISEYPPFAKPTKYTFPVRNRIIAGLSLGTLITEAGKKSGTIHTKEYALDYGRDVFAVPGNINSLKSELPNSLIRSAQAECVLEPEDILIRYNMDSPKLAKRAVEVSMDEEIILKLLKNGEQDFDELAKNSQLPTNILNSCLTTLEIRGLIKRMPAKTYMLS
ncbi:MAG TPA: DNA-protecting protein DprA [Candidatus Caccovivens faecavium]|nr:DNA-protecting protein DprA [Candidatus Caccovivens faecavium]